MRSLDLELNNLSFCFATFYLFHCLHTLLNMYNDTDLHADSSRSIIPGHHVPTRKSCARVGSPGPDKPPHAVGRPSFRPDNCAWFRGGQLPKRPSGGSTDRFSPGGLSIQWGTARRPSPAANLARARTRHVGDAALRRRTGRRGRRPAGCARRGTRSCRSWRGGRSSAPPCACAPSARRSARRRS